MILSWLYRKRLIGAEELRRKLAGGERILVVDVRGAEEFNGEDGHLDGATLCPLPEFKARGRKLVLEADRPVVLVCARGLRSLFALISAGKAVVPVVSLRGGMKEWNRRGYPVAHAELPDRNVGPPEEKESSDEKP